MKKIDNKFFDIISFFLSAIASFYRSLLLLIWRKTSVKRGVFFKWMDYFFRGWPDYFWKKPTWLKIWLFFALFIKHIFYNKKSKDENK